MMNEYADCLCWTCDSCGLEAEFPREGVGACATAVAELRQRGWLIARIGGEWTLGGTFIAEEWPEERRKMGAGLMHTGYYFGQP